MGGCISRQHTEYSSNISPVAASEGDLPDNGNLAEVVLDSNFSLAC